MADGHHPAALADGPHEEQLDKYRPPDEDSSFDCTETQELPHMYSPHPVVSDNWDLLHHDLGHWVSELPASPGKQELLPPPTRPQPSGITIAGSEGLVIADNVENGVSEASSKPPPDAAVARRCFTASQLPKGLPTKPIPASHPSGGRGSDIAQPPTREPLTDGQEASEGETLPFGHRPSPHGNPKRSRFNEAENSDAEHERCRRRREVE
ncbi:hypothetical protein F5144DRAFT_548097 [Chaetomium tenue]|uniref:Uncharacterized protein n=1 Tax=Chaetomium tenue TaxID=1854479 RepID=A0ACB7PB70_9PEZI|nr:hypothetical protein F5144DRAFT_548097 [Chaetomium globosum]